MFTNLYPLDKLMGHSSPVNCVGVLGGDGTDIEMIIGGAQVSVCIFFIDYTISRNILN